MNENFPEVFVDLIEKDKGVDSDSFVEKDKDVDAESFVENDKDVDAESFVENDKDVDAESFVEKDKVKKPVRVITPEIVSQACIKNGMSYDDIDTAIESVFAARGE